MFTFKRSFVSTKFFLSLIVLIVFLALPSIVASKVGVGIGTGKIVVDQPLKAGMINKLPEITVVNTGDVASEYAVSVQYHQDQKELKPAESWFVFTPEKFSLEPGGVQVVSISLHLPLQVEPGNYFSYLEAAPVMVSKDGSSQVGVAAAAKLNFSIEAANVFMGIYYKVIALWNFYQPWPARILLLFLLLIGAALAKRYIKIELKSK